jgi:hypothetical protein
MRIVAGVLCAAFNRIQGWHDALNLPFAERLPPSRCAMAAGRECRRVLAVGRG